MCLVPGLDTHVLYSVQCTYVKKNQKSDKNRCQCYVPGSVFGAGILIIFWGHSVGPILDLKNGKSSIQQFICKLKHQFSKHSITVFLHLKQQDPDSHLQKQNPDSHIQYKGRIRIRIYKSRNRIPIYCTRAGSGFAFTRAVSGFPFTVQGHGRIRIRIYKTQIRIRIYKTQIRIRIYKTQIRIRIYKNSQIRIRFPLVRKKLLAQIIYLVSSATNNF